MIAEQTNTAVVFRSAFFLLLISIAIAVALAPFLALAAVLGGLAFVFCCSEKRLKYALFALAAYTPFEEFLLKWVPDEIYFYARFAHYGFIGACLMVIVLRRFVEGRPIWIRTPLDVPLALFMLFSVISMLVNDSPPGAFLFSYQPLLRFIVLAFYAVQFIEFTEKDAMFQGIASAAIKRTGENTNNANAESSMSSIRFNMLGKPVIDTSLT